VPRSAKWGPTLPMSEIRLTTATNRKRRPLAEPPQQSQLQPTLAMPPKTRSVMILLLKRLLLPKRCLPVTIPSPTS
jgi:hypothetical protein